MAWNYFGPYIETFQMEGKERGKYGREFFGF
jgi:hypothetical protein